MNYLDFNSRNTYLEMRKQWSADFETGIKTIRKAKVAIKEAQRADSIGDIWAGYRALRDSREALDKLHSVKHQMKAEANRQWQASRQR